MTTLLRLLAALLAVTVGALLGAGTALLVDWLARGEMPRRVKL